MLAIIALLMFLGCAGYRGPNQPLTIEPIVVTHKLTSGYYKVTEATSLYESADAGSRKVGAVKAGEIIEVVDVAGAYAQIRFSENAGWVLDVDVEDTGARAIVRTLGEVQVKAQPNTLSSNIAVLEPGRLLTLKKREGSWLYVKISENRGWLMAGLIEPLGTTSQAASPRAVTEKVYWKVLKKSNLRSSPNTVSEILRLMPSGSSVVYLGTHGEWIQVEYDGTVGYVHEDLVSPH
jgi:N-acetylmuramoyl-L-alanine amidase